jgi:AraC family transcriptional regulator
MILREMPAIWDDRFKPWFYARWGRENCIIAAQARKAEYPSYRQCLSIKAAWGGRESYHIDGRRICVDDGTYVILNDGRTYASTLRAISPVTSFSIFFRPGMADEVAHEIVTPQERLLEDPAGTLRSSVGFHEHVRRHDRQITPVLRFIHRHVDAGVSSESWYEEQLYFLLQRMLFQQGRDRVDIDLIPAARPSTRRELFRRVGLAVDFIHANFSSSIGLNQIAAAAMLSPYHCLRVFKAVHGRTPTVYLNERRVECAQRLLHDSRNGVTDVAEWVGFKNRSTLFRQLKRAGVDGRRLGSNRAANE